MSRSGLASKFVQAKHFSKGRDGKKIRCITPHIMASRWSAEQCAKFFAGGSRKASTHYVIGISGEIIQCVDERDTAWANANWRSNCESITIECANIEIGGDWRISDATLNSLINLMEDIARRNNIKLVVGDTLNWHNMYTNTTCPGRYLRSKFDHIASVVNDRTLNIGNSTYNSIISNVKGDYEMRIWKNGRTKEIVYQDSRCTQRIGYLNPHETAYCVGELDNVYMIWYSIDGTWNGKNNNNKIGFVKYKG